MSEEARSRDDWLLADQLGQLTPEDRARLVDAMRRDERLAERHRRLQSILEPLDSWTVPEPPARLADRVIARVSRTMADAPVLRLPPLATGAEVSGRKTPFAMRDLVAVAATIVLVGVILIPGVSRVGGESRRLACSNNLGSIGQAVATYAADYGGALPVASSIPGGRWLQVSTGGGPYTPNRRNAFLLLQFRYVQEAKAFVCPSCNKSQVMRVANPHALSDFPDTRNCSYHLLNMSGPTPRLTVAPRHPLMADSNPLFVGGRFHRISPEMPSPNHRRPRGQNILCFDGAVDWTVTPKVGPSEDNIWQAGAVRIYQGTEMQTSAEDTFLVP